MLDPAPVLQRVLLLTIREPTNFDFVTGPIGTTWKSLLQIAQHLGERLCSTETLSPLMQSLTVVASPVNVKLLRLELAIMGFCQDSCRRHIVFGIAAALARRFV